MISKIHLIQIWFIGWNCLDVQMYTNVNELISDINEEYKLDHNIYIVESIEIDIEFIQNVHDVANTIFMSSSHLWNETLRQVYRHRSLVILIFEKLDSKRVENVLSDLKYLLNGDIKLLNIFGCQDAELWPNDRLTQILRLFWSKSILDVIAVNQCGKSDIDIFSYDPFGKLFGVVNLSNQTEHLYDTKIDKSHKRVLNLLVTPDITNIFAKKLPFTRKVSLGGPNGKMVSIFCKKLNAVCRYMPQSPFKMKTVMLTLNDLAPVPSPIVFESGDYSMQRYLNPLYFDTSVVIVKASRPMAPLKQFSSNIADSAINLSVIMLAVFLILCILRCRNFSEFSFVDICSLTLLITIKQDFREFFTLRLQEIVLLLPLFLLGFIISNTILSVLTSFYTTKTYYQPDVDSLSSVDELPCKIAVSKEHSGILSEFSEFNWTSRFVFLNPSEFNHKLFRFDISTCFIDGFRRADIVMRYQQRGPRVFHVVKTNLAPKLYGYMIHPMSPYKHRLNDVLLNIMSSGLYAKWSSDIHNELYELQILKYFVSIHEIKPTSLKLMYTFLPFTLLVYNSAIAMIMFCCEVLIGRFRLKTK